MVVLLVIFLKSRRKGRIKKCQSCWLIRRRETGDLEIGHFLIDRMIDGLFSLMTIVHLISWFCSLLCPVDQTKVKWFWPLLYGHQSKMSSFLTQQSWNREKVRWATVRKAVSKIPAVFLDDDILLWFLYRPAAHTFYFWRWTSFPDPEIICTQSSIQNNRSVSTTNS